MCDVCTYVRMPVDIDVVLGGVCKTVRDLVHDQSTSMLANWLTISFRVAALMHNMHACMHESYACMNCMWNGAKRITFKASSKAQFAANSVDRSKARSP